MRITAICDPIAFAERGYAVFVHRAEYPDIISDTGFTDLPGGHRFSLPPCRPAADYVLRIAAATIHFPNVVICGGTMLDANTAYTTPEHMRQDPEAMPLQQTADGFVLAESRNEFAASHAGYLSALPNYAAWLLGELPKAALYRTHGPPDLPILLHGEPREFHFESLAACGIPRDRLLLAAANRPVAARDMLYASPGYFHHTPSPAAAAFLRDSVLPAERGPPGGKIYLSRSRIRKRRIRNEPAMERLLSARGYEIVFPEDLTFREQVALFRRAEVVVAPYGAALANLAFVGPACKVMIVATKFTLEHAWLLDMRGIPFFVFAMYRRNWLRYLVRRQRRENVTEYIVDLRRFAEAVDMLERAETPPRAVAAEFRSLRQLRRNADHARRRK